MSLAQQLNLQDFFFLQIIFTQRQIPQAATSFLLVRKTSMWLRSTTQGVAVSLAAAKQTDKLGYYSGFFLLCFVSAGKVFSLATVSLNFTAQLTTGHVAHVPACIDGKPINWSFSAWRN